MRALSFASGDSSVLAIGGALASVLMLCTTAHAADPDDLDGAGAPVIVPEAPDAELEEADDAADDADVPVIVLEEPDARALPPGVSVHVNVNPTTCTGSACPSPERPAEQPPAVDAGTHFLFEIGLGASFGGGLGFAGDAIFGWGGRPFGMPLRFYVFAEAAHLSNEASGPMAGGSYQNGRRYLDLALGLRTYVPIYGALRIFADASIGAAYNTAQLERTGFGPLETDGWYAAVGVGGGLQLRLFPGLSVGARIRVLFTDDGLSPTRAALHIDDSTPFDLTGTVAWHF